MDYVVSLTGCIYAIEATGRRVADEEQVVESHLDAVMKELIGLNARDPAIDMDVTDNSVVMSVLVEAPTPVAAVGVATGYFRTAIHAAGGSTHDWPGQDHHAWEVTLVSLRCDLVTA